MTKDAYTVRDIAEQLQVTEKAVRQLILLNKLPARKICNKWIVSAADFKNLIETGEDNEANA